MKLEEEIKQSKFRNEQHKLGVNITFTYYWLADKLKQQLKKFGISMQQFNILRILRGQHPRPSTVNLLKERMLDKSSDASRLIERLRVKGYIQRHVCKSDRRSVDILITEKGLEVLKKIDSQSAEIDGVFSKLSDKEAATLNQLLDKIRS